MTHYPGRSSSADEGWRDRAARWAREGLDGVAAKHEGWARHALMKLELRSTSYAHRWLSGDQQIPLSAIIATADEYPALAEHVARRLAALVGKVLADAPRVTDCLNDYHAFAQLGSSAGKVLEEIGRALADGHIDRGEAVSMIAALDSLMEAAASYRARLQVVVRDGVDGARGLRAVEGGR